MFPIINNKRFLAHTTLLALVTIAIPAHAYLGPGGAVSSIGALLALIGAVFLAVIGFVWFPVKRMLARKQQATDEEEDSDGDGDGDGDGDENAKEEISNP